MCQLPEHWKADELLESIPLAKVPSSGQRTDQTLGSAKQFDDLQNIQPLFCVRIFRKKGAHAPRKKTRDELLLPGRKSGGFATARQKGMARGEGVLECGGMTPLWIGAARGDARPLGLVRAESPT